MKKIDGFALWSCLLLLLTPLGFAQNQHAFFWSTTGGMVDLGTLGGNSSTATGINDSGEVVGWSYLADNVTYHGFTWTAPGGMVDIGTLGGCCSQGYEINTSGNYTGDSINPDGSQSPLYWSLSTGLVSLGEFSGDQRNYSFGINDNNYVTGQIYSGEVVHAFIWTAPSGPLVSLGHLPGALHSVGIGINNELDVVGTASLPTCCSFTSMIWSPATGMHDLGMFPGSPYTAAESINDSKEVVGWGETNSSETQQSAFYWSQATGHAVLATLGGDQTYAWGISKNGAIAGHSTLPGNTATHAVIWNSYSSAPTDLGTLPGGANSYGRGINTLGQVVGYADVP